MIVLSEGAGLAATKSLVEGDGDEGKKPGEEEIAGEDEGDDHHENCTDLIQKNGTGRGL